MSRTVPTLAALCLVALFGAADAFAIEAVRGKSYELTKAHGPWMIMVASLSDRDSTAAKEGKSARQAADELIYELRTKGIPAYAFEMEKTTLEVGKGRNQSRKLIRAGGQISVIAGNYGGVSSESAVKTLAWIKAYFPKCLAEDGVWSQTPGRPGPLSGAFLTVNPLLTPDEIVEVARKTPEGRKEWEAQKKLLRWLNAHNNYPLSEADGSHSMAIAWFKGKTLTTNMATAEQKQRAFSKLKTDPINGKDSVMSENYVRADQLCTVLRNEGIEAYAWHTKFESYVTVGSFNGPNDPSIPIYRKKFGLTYEKNPQTGQRVPIHKFRQVGGFGKDKTETRMWMFEPEPMLVKVPEVN